MGDLIGRALPFGHSYWVLLVAILIMRPGFSRTYGRAAARLGGTLVGLVIADAIVQLAQPGPAVSGLLSVICGGLILLFVYTGYAPVQAAASGYVVFTLAMAGVGLARSVPAHLVLTLVGGCLAMLACAVYPAWETPRLRTRLADWIKADLVYAATVVRHYADPTRAVRPGDARSRPVRPHSHPGLAQRRGPGREEARTPTRPLPHRGSRSRAGPRRLRPHHHASGSPPARPRQPPPEPSSSPPWTNSPPPWNTPPPMTTTGTPVQAEAA